MTIRRTLVALVLCTTTAACGSDTGVTVPEGSDRLDRCDAPTPIDVADIASSGTLRRCDAAGARLVFPGDLTVTVPAIGSTTARDEPTTSSAPILVVTNWGTAGPSAARTLAGTLQVWGSRRALLLYSEAVFRAQDPAA